MPNLFRNNQEVYDHVDATIDSLRQSGFTGDAERLHHLLHKVAWTTSSELFGELGHALLTIAENPKLPPAVRDQIESCIAAVEMIWPDIRNQRGGL
jgi:hypothetical protein